MKKWTAFCCCILFAGFVHAQQPGYNKTLADSLGADAYGMKSYVLVILKTGPATVPAREKVDSLFSGHMNNMGRLVKEGKLLLAGPLEKNDRQYRGIFILNVKTAAEARVILDTDPAVKSGLLAAEIYPWYGSAALPMYLPYHDRIQEKSF